MESGFSFKLDSLMRISGSSSFDLPFAEKCTSEMYAFVKTQSEIIKDYSELTNIMDIDSKKILGNCLTAINHIYQVLLDLYNFFINSSIRQPFEETFNKVTEIRNIAKERVSQLVSYTVIE